MNTPNYAYQYSVSQCPFQTSDQKLSLFHASKKKLKPRSLTIRRKIPGRISGNFHGQVVQSFSSVGDYFPELFPGSFRAICPRFENFEILGRMVSAPSYDL